MLLSTNNKNILLKIYHDKIIYINKYTFINNIITINNDI